MYIKYHRPIPTSLKIYLDKSMNIENDELIKFINIKSPNITFDNLMYVGW